MEIGKKVLTFIRRLTILQYSEDSILEFTYIGNIPKSFEFKNSKLIAPKNDLEIAKLLRTFDGYVTKKMNHLETII